VAVIGAFSTPGPLHRSDKWKQQDNVPRLSNNNVLVVLL
jgi:hypothetical protein